MFPFHRSCELSFQIANDLEQNKSTNSMTFYHNQNQQVGTDVSASNAAHHSHLNDNTNLIFSSLNPRKTRPRISLTSSKVNVNHSTNPNPNEISENDVVKKRVIHREIERQRRQDMSNLYSSLRSLLPMEYIRGKRSICDHITEAATYIKDMEKNVKELGDKRDKLKGSCSLLGRHRLTSEGGCSSSGAPSRSRCSVSIHTFSATIEVEISAGFEDEEVFPLSRALQVLIEEGHNVVNCVSSKVNQRWIYVIHCEVNDVASVDVKMLQQRLMREISSSTSS